MRIATEEATYRIGESCVVVRTNCDGLLGSLDQFYDREAGRSSLKAWELLSYLADPAPGMPLNPYGVGVLAEPTLRRITLVSPNGFNLRVTTRKCAREVMVGRCEEARYTMLHASAVYSDCQVVIYAGDKGSGKTTLALRTVLDHGYRLLSNDHLIVFRSTEPGMLTLTSLPTLIPVKIGTFLDLEDRLPKPFEMPSDSNSFRQMSPGARYAADSRVLYTYKGLGQPNPVLAQIGRDRTACRVAIVFPSYAHSTGEGVEVRPLTCAWSHLAGHIRVDWAFDPQLNQHHIPRSERNATEFLEDGQQLVRELAGFARAFSYRHDGNPTRLLAHLDQGS